MELPHHIDLTILNSLLHNNISLSTADIKKINDNHAFLNTKLQSGSTYYGINTGFGSLCNVRINDADIKKLQENLVCSHACGFGDEVSSDIVKIMLLLKIRNMAQGFSGVKLETVELLLKLYNENILPQVFEQGSLGASGDLAPLAHISLALLGKGKVHYKGNLVDTPSVFSEKNITPTELHAKEGLALLNGTQFMSAHAVWALLKAQNLIKWADIIAALSLDGFDGKLEPYNALLHHIRPHKGQIATAAFISNILNGSELQAREKTQTQDPYSFRCVPQVHGATKDAIAHIKQVTEIEINSVTDNPTVFENEDLILSGGNFHGQPLAINLDYMAIAMAELANISERRTYLLISGTRDLPAFLVSEPGLNSGLMIAQYTAAAIVSQNKQLCTPASVDSIVSSNGQEDHVSMGANAATKLKKVIDNVQRVLAIELIAAAQAIEFRKPQHTSAPLQRLLAAFRNVVPFIQKDKILHDDLVLAEQFLDQNPEAIMQ